MLVNLAGKEFATSEDMKIIRLTVSWTRHGRRKGGSEEWQQAQTSGEQYGSERGGGWLFKVEKKKWLELSVLKESSGYEDDILVMM